MKVISSNIFYRDRIDVDIIDDSNRDILFVEVDQLDLKQKIFLPLYNLNKYKYRFFQKRFAILGDFRIGKSELGNYIIQKMKNHYQKENLIAITINSEKAKDKTKENIDNWLYDQWLITLRQVEQSNFKKKVNEVLDAFKEERGYACEEIAEDNFIDKIHLICKIYREYRRVNKKAKFIVEFEQANVIYEKKNDFLPFYSFWRNFQGFWEDKKYFAGLGLFIFVVGHIIWKDFGYLIEPSGRGIFDVIIEYNHWNNSDINDMFKKRLEYAMKPEYHEEFIDYYLRGIVDFFSIKLRKVNTVEYLDAYFGPNGYLEKFLKDYSVNFKKYKKGFLEFCKSFHRDEKYDDTYFEYVEDKFISGTSTDYMPVFRYLSDNQDESWFNGFFKLIEYLFEKHRIVFGSKIFNTQFTILSEKFITDNFSFDNKNALTPEHNPPIFNHYNRDLMLDRLFKDCLSAIPSDKQGPVYRLKRFLTSNRIKHNNFLESQDGKEAEDLLKKNIKKAEKIYDIVNKWSRGNWYGVIGEKEVFTGDDLLPFYHLRTVLYNLNQMYKGNSTNWAKFDGEARDLGIYIIEELFPTSSPVLAYVNLEEFRSDFLSEIVSNIVMIRLMNEFLKSIKKKIKIFDGVISEKNIRKEKTSGYEEEVISELIKRIPKYKGKTLEKSDCINFLEQFPDELKTAAVTLLKRIIFFSQESMTEKIKEIIDRIHYEKGTTLILGVLDDLINKSNSYCSYLIKKSNLSGFKIIKSSDIIKIVDKEGASKNIIIIFIDDVIGTGQQFVKSYNKSFNERFQKLANNKKKNVKQYLVSCIGSSGSINYIAKETLLQADFIKYVKLVKKEDKALYYGNWKDQKLLKKLKEFLKSNDPENWDGWKLDPKDPKLEGTEFLAVFDWNVPNSTISCLWKDTDKWKALFPRS